MSDYNRMRAKAREIAAAAPKKAGGKIDDWIKESLELAGTEVYTPVIREYVQSRETRGDFGKVNLPAGYFKQGGAVCKKRAAAAATRLSMLLGGH